MKNFVIRNNKCKDGELPYSAIELAPYEKVDAAHDILQEYNSYDKAREIADKANESRQKLLSPHDHYCAAMSQDACNLSGIVFEFSRIMQKICDEAAMFGHGTEWKNSHPISRMYAEQILHLTMARDYSEASNYCEARKP
jgi:hypothetical protein